MKGETEAALLLFLLMLIGGACAVIAYFDARDQRTLDASAEAGR